MQIYVLHMQIGKTNLQRIALGFFLYSLLLTYVTCLLWMCALHTTKQQQHGDNNTYRVWY